VVDRGLVVFASESFCRSMGIPHGAVIGMPLVDLVASQSLDDLAGACRKWCTTGDSEHEHVDLALVGGSGRLVHFRVTGGAFERGGRRLAWMVMHDLTERRRLERWLKDERKRYQELFDKLPVGALYISPRGRIVDCNATVSDIVGYPRERIRGSLFTEYVGAEQAEALRRDFRELFTRGERISRRETAIEASDGKVITIEYDARLIYKKGLRTMALMVFADITEKKTLELELLEKNAEMERTLWDMAEVKDALEARAGELNRATEELKLLNEKLNMLSITDGLTEVYNHRHFQDRLSEEVERLNRLKDGVLSLLMIDIDDFKKFNDTYGHQCGDAVLKHIAFLIKSSIRNIDIVARYGGEEFAVILPNAASDQARVVAERICRIVRSTPLALGGSVRPGVTVSIGVGTIRTGETDKSRLVHMADSALYAAKAKWKDRVEVWEEVA
ncbi:MAG TPA: diguanylate cyclase, partial [Deltaproteobacteria bacterium]|nr:diguanylate cyclase [Deltaproteobacteria bacterium]